MDSEEDDMPITFNYDIESDALLIRLSDEDICETIPITGNLIVDVNDEGGLICVEVLGLSYILCKQVEEICKAFYDEVNIDFILEPQGKIPVEFNNEDLRWLNKLNTDTYQRRKQTG